MARKHSLKNQIQKKFSGDFKQQKLLELPSLYFYCLKNTENKQKDPLFVTFILPSCSRHPGRVAGNKNTILRYYFVNLRGKDKPHAAAEPTPKMPSPDFWLSEIINCCQSATST